MARPREFDEDKVLDSAMQVFWSRGYEATSIQDLVDATGLGRASLYGAFGDKRAVFSRVLSRYQDKLAQELGAAGVGLSPFAAIEALAGRWVELACPKTGPRGCMLVLAGTGDNAEDSWAKEALAAATRANETTFEEFFRRAQASGELGATRDPAALARYLIVLLQGVATAARGGIFGKERLYEVVTTALADLRERPEKEASVGAGRRAAGASPRKPRRARPAAR